ncbi:MAG: DNA-processing protein DprA, partial [Calditrichia bacterium]
ALAHLPKWRTEKINRLIVEILHDSGISFEEFFKLDPAAWQEEFHLNTREIKDLLAAQTELPNYSFLSESLLEQGFELIPINSREYSSTLKQNLKLKYAPPLLYIKGNKKLLQEDSVAIVGSRKASATALEFTTRIAEICAKNYQVVVSGFAKGVDKTALDATLKVHGHSIIVLPQGIMTFGSGFKKYYSQIIEGDVLVLSTFHPKTPWSVGLAMARNVYIYGLAGTIYVAESHTKGGTWSGVVDGLRKGRKIFVRLPLPGENNSNDILIQKGAVPVDMNGRVVEYVHTDNFEERLKKVLSVTPLTANQIIEKLQLDYSARHLTNLLKKMDFVVREKRNSKFFYYLKSSRKLQGELFGQD